MPEILRTSVKLEIARLPHDTCVARRYENSSACAVGIPDEIVMAEDVEELAALDWPKLLKDQLAGMMTTQAAYREVVEPRRAAVVAFEAFDAVRRVMGE